MLKEAFLLVSILILPIIFPLNIFASDLVINEIFANPIDENDEYIELYNKSEVEIDISNWEIEDLVKSYQIIDTKIPAKSFFVLEKSLTGIALNNSDEKVSLSDSDGNEVDVFSYDNTIEDKSWSRVPDGQNEFFNNTDKSKGAPNFSAPTPTSTSSPTPTKTPKPTKAPTSTKAPTATKAMKVSAEQVYEQEDEVLSRDTKKSAIDIISTPRNQVIAGISDEEEKEVIGSEKADESTPTYLYSITTGVGMLTLACAILLYRRFKAKNEEEDF